MSKIIFNSIYKGLPINSNSKLGCRTDILDKLKQLLDFYTTKHNKVIFIRFDLHFPAGYHFQNSGEYFSEFMAWYIKILKRQGFDPYYFWVREQNKSINPHYHCILLLNGNLVQKYYYYVKIAEDCWMRTLGFHDAEGLVDYCCQGKNGIMIRRDDTFQQFYNLCYYWGSYLAKTNQKGNAPKGAHEWGSSKFQSL